jgi:hypothetical protein
MFAKKRAIFWLRILTWEAKLPLFKAGKLIPENCPRIEK